MHLCYIQDTESAPECETQNILGATKYFLWLRRHFFHFDQIAQKRGAVSLDTTSLYYFTEAAKDLNFTQTANRLFLSQQNLSSHIARLEAKCGCKLFQRKPKVQLTYEGELFLAYAKEAVASEGNILSALKAVANEDSGRLHIGVSTPRAAIFIPEILQDFSRDYPGVSVRLSDLPSYLLERQLADNAIDFCVGVFQSQNPELETTHLLSDGLYLCMSDALLQQYAPGRAEALLRTGSDGISLAEFPGLPVALPSDGIPLSRVILSCYEEAGDTPNVLLTTAYPQSFRSLYFHGTAACFATGMILNDLQRNRPSGAPPLHAFPLLLNGNLIKREISLLTNRRRYLSKPAKHFIALTQALFAAIELERAGSEPSRGQFFRGGDAAAL